MLRKAFYENKASSVSELSRENISTAWKNGDWRFSLPGAALHQAQKRPSRENIYLALKIQHAISGLDSNSVKCFSQLLIESHEKKKWSKATMRLLCAQLQLENKDMAHESVAHFFRGNCTFFKARCLNRFPTALHFLHENFPEKLSARQAKQSRLSSILLKRIDIVGEPLIHSLSNQQQIKAQEKTSIAVVGNSPSLLTHSHGQYIDSHDVVIRFNNAVLTDSYKRHTGEKTSLRIVSPNLVKRTPHAGMDALAISGINIFHGESGYWDCLANLPPHVKLAVFDQRIWYELVEQLSAPPSAGLLTLASLAKLPGVEINAFGFSAEVQKKPKSASTDNSRFGYSVGRNHYGDRKPASIRHNWELEAEVIDRLVHSIPKLQLGRL